MTRTISNPLRLMALIGVTSAAVFAQIGGGSIVGTATDPSGAVVSGAKITAVAVETNERRDTYTNDQGYFEFPLLPAGEYQLEAEKTGFRRSTTARFALNSGTRPRFDIRLELGDITQSVEVVSTAPVVNATTTDLGVVMNEAKVESLPLNGRNFQQLVSLQPGVISGPASGAGDRGGIQFNGSSALGNNLLLDGVDMSFGEVNGTASDRAAGGGGLLINGISLEAIQEFKSTSSAFSAEYGRATGGVLNVTTKSGTNEFHGSLFEFFRNDKLDANSFFSNASGLPKPPLRWNQYGGNIGGPIRRDRIFFLFNYEGAEVRRAQTVTGNVPTPALLSQLKPAIQQLFQGMFPTTFTATSNPLIGLHRRNDVQKNDENTYFGRTDFNFGQHRLATRFNYNHQDYTTPLLYPTMPRPFPLRSHNALVQDSWTLSPSIFNELRLGFNRVNLNRYELNRDNFPAWIQVSDVNLNANLPSFIDFTTTTYTLADNLSAIRGSHTIKGGFEIRVLRSARGQGGQPTHIYNNLADLIADRPNREQLLFGGGKGLHTTNTSFYVQDDWRATSRLQVNFGLRYEYSPPLSGAFNIASSNPWGPFLQTASEPMFAPDHNDFAPRLGLIYDVTGNQKLVIRAGGAITYLPEQPIFFYDMAFINPRLPFVATLNPTDIPNAPTTYPFPASLIDAIASNPSLLPANFVLSRSIADFNNRDSYAGQWNFSIQSAITPTLALQAAYAGSRTLKLTTPQPLNLVDPRLGRRPDPTIGDINMMENASNITYHSLQISLNQRLAKGLTFDAYYTWSKALGYFSPDNALNFTNSAIADPNNLRGSYGPMQGEVRHLFTGVFSYRLPSAQFAKSGFAKAALGGWTIDGLPTWRSGLPINVLSGRDLYGNGRVTGQRPDLVLGVDPYVRDTTGLVWLNRAAFDLTAPLAQKRFGNLGYNVFRGPSGFAMDAAIHKTFDLTERQHLTFRLELFNAFNHKILGNPDSNVSSATFGRILSASGPRNIQLALKYRF